MLRLSLKSVRGLSTKTRVASTNLPPGEKQQSERKVSSREKAELISSSLKSIFDGFLTNEETYEPVDIKPVLGNPRKFVELHQYHRDQIMEDLEKRFKQPWRNVSDDYKRLAYFISYGNYSAREDFKDNLFQDCKPEDLPFTKPSPLGVPGAKIHKVPEVDLWQVSPGRRADFRKITRTLDPMSKTVVYLAAVIALIALYRDKTVGEDDTLLDIPESPLLIADMKHQKEWELAREDKLLKEQAEQRHSGKKWYYLWLK